MRHGSLFSGIGGFDLAAEWMGWENVFHCEWNEFGQKVLKHYWPNAISYGDITKTDFSIHRGQIDIITGGFPCQPYSQAGKRKGKDDDRHLWPEMLRAIREIQPSWVVGENVPGLLNWNGGMVLDEIKTDLEAAGFEVFPPLVLPACGLNAPHRRDRVWIVANAKSNRGYRTPNEASGKTKGQNGKPVKQSFVGSEVWVTTNSDLNQQSTIRGNIKEVRGLQNEKSGTENGSPVFGGSDIKLTTPNSQRLRQQGLGRSKGQSNSEAFRNWKASWSDPNGGWPTVSPIRSGNDGIPNGLAEHSISKTKWLKECLMAAGNTVVPQIVLEIFKAIEQYESL